MEPAREKDERCSAKGVLIALPNPTTASARLFGLILPTATRRRPLPVLAADATTASAALFWHMHTHTQSPSQHHSFTARRLLSAGPPSACRVAAGVEWPGASDGKPESSAPPNAD